MMTIDALQAAIDDAWEARGDLRPGARGPAVDAIMEVLRLLDDGALRVATPDAADGEWTVHEWVKKAVLLYFRISETALMTGGPEHPTYGMAPWWDKMRLKFAGWTAERFTKSGFRAASGAIVRYSAYVAPNVVLMPCFVNVGARIEENCMIDTWATVGSCAQVGRNCHVSGGAGLGGVLEPMQARPVIVEDDCFIGARAEIVEGVRVGRGSVIAMGVFLSSTTRIVDRTTGEITTGAVPPFSVVVPGSMPSRALASGQPGPHLACAVIVKRVDAQTRSKVSINDLLRDAIDETR